MIRFSISDKGIRFLIYIVADMKRILRLMERWKDTGASVALEGARVVEFLVQGGGELYTASPFGAVHIGPKDASVVRRPHINSPSGLNRCDKVILAILLHTVFCTIFLQEA